jgi:hypothetical protein
MTDAPKPTLSLLSGKAVRDGDIDAIADFAERGLGRPMTPDELAYAVAKLGRPKKDEA